MGGLDSEHLNSTQNDKKDIEESKLHSYEKSKVYR